MESHTDSIIQIWAVRHGQTVDNVAGIYQGQQDGKLTDLGIEQARVLGKRLANESFGIHYVSDLGRTRETWKAINESGLTDENDSQNVIYSRLLREKAGGIFENKHGDFMLEDIRKSGVPLRKYKPDGGEDWEDVHNRVISTIKMIFYDTFVAKKHSMIYLKQPNPESC